MNEEDGSRRVENIRLLFEQLVPFNRFMGLRVLEIDGEHGTIRLQVPFRPEYIGNPQVPALHGGVVSMLLDTAGGAAVWSRVDLTGQVSTVDLRVDYLRPGRPEPLIGMGRVVRLGNRVGVAELRAYHPGAEDEPIAAGMGVYNVRRGAPLDEAALRRAIEASKG